MDLQDGATPLHYAAEGHDSTTIGLLLEAGADITARDRVPSCGAIFDQSDDVCPKHPWKVFNSFYTNFLIPTSHGLHMLMAIEF